MDSASDSTITAVEDGATVHVTTETNVPYALYGDNPDVDPWDLFNKGSIEAGQYEIVVAFVNGAGGQLADGTDYIYHLVLLAVA
jgi:hypothetical protein